MRSSCLTTQERIRSSTSFSQTICYCSRHLRSVAQTTLSSTGGLDIAATPNLQAYILNSDGTIQRVDYSNAVFYAFQDGATNDGAIALALMRRRAARLRRFEWHI